MNGFYYSKPFKSQSFDEFVSCSRVIYGFCRVLIKLENFKNAALKKDTVFKDIILDVKQYTLLKIKVLYDGIRSILGCMVP